MVKPLESSSKTVPAKIQEACNIVMNNVHSVDLDELNMIREIIGMAEYEYPYQELEANNYVYENNRILDKATRDVLHFWWSFVPDQYKKSEEAKEMFLRVINGYDVIFEPVSTDNPGHLHNKPYTDIQPETAVCSRVKCSVTNEYLGSIVIDDPVQDYAIAEISENPEKDVYAEIHAALAKHGISDED